MDLSRKRPIIFAIRDFPPGCGTHFDASSFHLPEKVIKNPRTSFNNQSIDRNHVVAAPKPNGASMRQEPVFRHSDHHPRVIVAALRANGASLKQETEIRNPDHRHLAVAAALKTNGTSLKQEPELRNSSDHHNRVVSAARNPLRHSDHQPERTPCEKVLEVLSIFNQVFSQLERDKEARRGGDLFDATARIDLKTQAVLENIGKRVNTEKRIGSIPGIEVGDVFQYKAELRLVGLHFKTMCGIDYMTIGDVKLATSIVASEGYGYNDTFCSDVVVYTGEGGNVIGKEKNYEDQKLANGNLALANSMRYKSEVRVTRGEERWDRKGKRYVYNGLYLVDQYWEENGASGKILYKFRLCRIPGQRPLT